MTIDSRKKWELHIGWHKGTLLSRDSEIRELDSLEECQRSLAKSEKSWATLGYFVWYARAVNPDGEKFLLHPGIPYKPEKP
jgi:hypothetical protein